MTAKKKVEQKPPAIPVTDTVDGLIEKAKDESKPAPKKKGA